MLWQPNGTVARRSPVAPRRRQRPKCTLRLYLGCHRTYRSPDVTLGSVGGGLFFPFLGPLFCIFWLFLFYKKYVKIQNIPESGQLSKQSSSSSSSSSRPEHEHEPRRHVNGSIRCTPDGYRRVFGLLFNIFAILFFLFFCKFMQKNVK